MKMITKISLWVLGICAVVFLVVGSLNFAGVKIGAVQQTQFGGTDTSATTDNTFSDNLGDATSLTLNVQDYAGNSVSTVTVNDMLVYAKKTGDVLHTFIQSAASSSTFTKEVVGKTYYVGTNSSSYYVDAAPEGYAITDAASTFDLKAYAIATESSMTVAVYDSDNNALTADDNATNTADYTYAVGADGKKPVTVKLTNSQADKAFRVGAICTFAGTNSSGVSDFTITDSKFKEASIIPKQIRDASLTLTNDIGTTSSETGYDHCYVPASEKFIQLNEWDELSVKALIEAGTSDPIANGFNEVGVLFIDFGSNTDSSNQMVADWYRHDVNERVTEVGLSDTTTSPMGLTSGAIVELS